jgi:hypothetical protein
MKLYIVDDDYVAARPRGLNFCCCEEGAMFHDSRCARCGKPVLGRSREYLRADGESQAWDRMMRQAPARKGRRLAA